MVRNLIGSLVKRVRKLVFSVNSETSNQVDEYVLEHLLLYHGLVGSSPENQRSFREVREDINRAVRNNSSLQMTVVLQLPPQWWEDKLRAIFEEIVAKEGSERAINALHPEMPDDAWPNRVDPLGHPDWRVRANAATVLSSLQARKAAERMIRSLRDCAADYKSAFCHIAYALGRLGAEPARAALAEYLQSDEQWFRVDAAGALAHWPAAIVSDSLMNAMLSLNELPDYMAIAIARQHKPIDFFRDAHASARQGACAMVLSILDASRQTFGADVAAENGLAQCIKPVIELARSEPTPVSLRAVLSLADWLKEYGNGGDSTVPSEEELEAVVQELTAGGVIERVVLDSLQTAEARSSKEFVQVAQAIVLAGELHITNAVPPLIALLLPDNALADYAVEALGTIADHSSVTPLIELANQLVTMSSRTALPLSKQPVEEQNASASKTHWKILKALGARYTREAAKYLVAAAGDFAPDQRDQALDSLVRLFSEKLDASLELQNEVRQALIAALSDPSPAVRTTALRGVETLDAEEAIPEVVKLTDSPEISVSRQAYATLESLWQAGHAGAIKAAGDERLRAHAKTHWAGQFTDFINAAH
ncbi:MAG TPA: hypothetical protein V6C81_17965 [Planktothrix sp.]|jgi:HEAT repeat protein